MGRTSPKPPIHRQQRSVCVRVCQDLRHAHVDDSATHACCSRCGDRHCTVTVASTTAGGRCNPRTTRVAPPHPPWMGAGQGYVMAARPLFTECGKRQTLAAVGPRHGLFRNVREAHSLGPWVNGPSRLAVPTGTQRDANGACSAGKPYSLCTNRTGVSCAPFHSHVATARGRSRNT